MSNRQRDKLARAAGRRILREGGTGFVKFSYLTDEEDVFEIVQFVAPLGGENKREILKFIQVTAGTGKAKLIANRNGITTKPTVGIFRA